MKISDELLEAEGNRRRPGKRLTTPERWEVGQLIKSGVLSVKDYPDFDAEGDVRSALQLPAFLGLTCSTACFT